MALFTSSLNSGSNGNCYYVGNTEEAVLVDVGISCRELEKRMLRSGLSLKKVKAIFISHEHTDHISGVEVVSRKYGIPVYISRRTLSQSRLSLEPALIRDFNPNEYITIGGISVLPFPKLHDAGDPYSYVIEYKDVRIGVFTDIGDTCEHVISNFKRCHAVFLEANYDVEMLENGRYPYYLKKRISGGMGHLSNDQALSLFLSHRSNFLSHLFLSHLSKDNNSPELVYNLFSKHAGVTRIEVASRFKETEVFYISGNTEVSDTARMESPLNTQMSLF
jgi:phosphoribosyl 1,2-cyclic phosphodiesterase